MPNKLRHATAGQQPANSRQAPGTSLGC